MLGLIFFVASFACFFALTIFFPAMPPGDLLINLFSTHNETSMIAGISSDLFISALVNGFSWAIIVTLVFFFLRGPGKSKKDVPLWVPGYAKSHNSKDDK